MLSLALRRGLARYDVHEFFGVHVGVFWVTDQTVGSSCRWISGTSQNFLFRAVHRPVALVHVLPKPWHIELSNEQNRQVRFS